MGRKIINTGSEGASTSSSLNVIDDTSVNCSRCASLEESLENLKKNHETLLEKLALLQKKKQIKDYFRHLIPTKKQMQAFFDGFIILTCLPVIASVAVVWLYASFYFIPKTMYCLIATGGGYQPATFFNDECHYTKS